MPGKCASAHEMLGTKIAYRGTEHRQIANRGFVAYPIASAATYFCGNHESSLERYASTTTSIGTCLLMQILRNRVAARSALTGH